MKKTLEQEFADLVIGRLSKNFNVFEEQWDRTGKNRIDYIITEKNTLLPFGVEFKTNDKKRGEEIGEHILQSMRYACSEFKVNGIWRRIPILMCPPISFSYLQCPLEESLKVEDSVYGNGKAEYFHDRHKRNDPHHTVNGLLGALGIGEIRTIKREDYKTKKERQYMRFSFSNKPLWEEAPEYLETEPKGIHQKNYEFQISKPIIYSFA